MKPKDVLISPLTGRGAATLTRVRRGPRDLNPTIRGFLVIALIAAVVVVLQLERTLSALFILARIAFFLAIAYFLFLVIIVITAIQFRVGRRFTHYRS